MSDRPAIVARLRGWLIKDLRPFGAEATQDVLDALATVPHSGDDDAYFIEACHLLSLTVPRLVQARIDALHAQIAANDTAANALEAWINSAHRANREVFRLAETTSTIH